MESVIGVLHQYQGQVRVEDLFSNNLNAQMQKDVIERQVTYLLRNYSTYTKLYAIPVSWWKEWCKYVNFNDPFLHSVPTTSISLQKVNSAHNN